jgi:hypothetical protein
MLLLIAANMSQMQQQAKSHPESLVFLDPGEVSEFF